MAALWTEVCLTFPALEAMEAGYEVYIVTDASTRWYVWAKRF
ncbi:isochorismatase family protein [Pseudomonas sp. HD6422]|nr:isochorismatase family protein [Pseudomonas sp. HD6422]